MKSMRNAAVCVVAVAVVAAGCAKEEERPSGNVKDVICENASAELAKVQSERDALTPMPGFLSVEDWNQRMAALDERERGWREKLAEYACEPVAADQGGEVQMTTEPIGEESLLEPATTDGGPNERQVFDMPAENSWNEAAPASPDDRGSVVPGSSVPGTHWVYQGSGKPEGGGVFAWTPTLEPFDQGQCHAPNHRDRLAVCFDDREFPYRYQDINQRLQGVVVFCMYIDPYMGTDLLTRDFGRVYRCEWSAE